MCALAQVSSQEQDFLESSLLSLLLELLRSSSPDCHFFGGASQFGEDCTSVACNPENTAPA
jgi:hypothetical protein